MATNTHTSANALASTGKEMLTHALAHTLLFSRSRSFRGSTLTNQAGHASCTKGVSERQQKG